MEVTDKQLEFIWLEGPNNDYTTEYKVLFPESWKVQDFMDYIVSDFSVNGEYHSGDISIYKATNHFDGATYDVIEYNNGNCVLAPTAHYLSDTRKQELQNRSRQILEESFEKPIKKVLAYESIHTMNFTIYV